MASTPDLADPFVRGTDGDDVIRTEQSVTFVWVPDAGDASSGSYWSYSGGADGGSYSTEWAGPSSATGSIVFSGVSSSEAFSAPISVDYQPDLPNSGFPWFVFTGGQGISIADSSNWTWDPLEGTFTGGFATDYWGASMYPNSVHYSEGGYWSFSSLTERGHWELAPYTQDVVVHAGAGNDTIYGGQGNQQLFGGSGNDMIWLGRGDSIALGEAGRDVIHGGVGAQMLDGGAGDDVLWGGRGVQTLRGGSGSDEIRAGTGEQTALGGAGADILWGGAGTQMLLGEAGNDVLNAGRGYQKLYGGGGRDTFVFHGTGQVQVMDFRVGQDIVAVDVAFANGLAGIAARLLSDAEGSAVLDVDGGATLTWLGISEQQVRAHLSDYCVLAAA